MRILHAPWNMAGQASTISRAQRKLGHKSDVWIFRNNALNYPHDWNLELDKKTIPKAQITQIMAMLKAIRGYDVIHFHSGTTFLPMHLDVILFRFLGKKTFMHYWGGEILQTDIAKRETLFDDDTIRLRILKGVSDKKRRRKIQWEHMIINETIAGDYSLLPYAPKSIVIRQAFDLESIPKEGNTVNKRVQIIHAPTKREVKGTKFVIEAIDILRKEGLDFDFIIVENTPHDEAMKIFAQGDIVVDDVKQGPYGLLAIECMAMGKVVLGRVNPSILHYYDGLPIVNTTPDNIAENLRWLIFDTKARKDLGNKGKEYVKTNHDSSIIAEQLIELYKSS